MDRGDAADERFDLTVPTSTVVGTLTPTAQAIDGLAFSPSGVLYGLSTTGVASLYTIDPPTANMTLVGSTGVLPPGPGSTLGGLAFDSSGNLFGILSASGGNPSFLYSINTATGAATQIGGSVFNEVCGLSFGSPPAPGVTIVQSGGSTDVAEGGATDSYTLRLNTAPTANVAVTVNPGTQLSVAPATLTFTPANWSTAQTITVSAIDDALPEGTHFGTLSHTATSTDVNYNGIAIAPIPVTITDNDGPAPTGEGTEGSHSGSSGGHTGLEGSYGFGHRNVRFQALLGPFPKELGNLHVFHVSKQQSPTTTSLATAAQVDAVGDLAPLLIAGLVGGLSLLLLAVVVKSLS